MEPRNTITRAATATARKSGLSSLCNLFLLVWQRFWLQFHVLWWLLCLSTSGNCKYSSVSPSWESGEKKHARSALNVALEENNPKRRSRDPGAPNPPHLTHYPIAPWLTHPPAWWVPPWGTIWNRGQDPETHHVLWWIPSFSGSHPLCIK